MNDNAHLSPHETVARILGRQPGAGADALISILQDVQDELGWIAPESIEAIARHLRIPASRVFGVATFYNQFRLQRPGRYRIAICRGTACHVIGSATLLEALESELGVRAGETTRDGLFSLEVVACLGACSMAPLMVVNDEFHGRLTARSMLKVVKDLRRREKTAARAAAAPAEGRAA